MLRVDSSSILVVPPFECAWLLDEARQLKDNACCVAFEAKGVTFILRWSMIQYRVTEESMPRGSSVVPAPLCLNAVGC